MFLKDLNNFNSDLLDGKHASNTANNVPVLDSSAKLPIAQIPTGTTSSTVSLGNHTHSNVETANTLATARTINGTSFNGSANITTANWGTARNIYIADSDGTNTSAAVSVNGSANATLKLPATIKASLSGNASTSTKATQDSAGQQINTTYIKGLSVSGGTITITKGNGGTSSITLPSASTSATGIVQLNNTVTSTSTTQGATANAVKLAYDKANEAFQSASDGKTKIATAITGKGVDASSSDTFDVLSEKISKITSDNLVSGDYNTGYFGKVADIITGKNLSSLVGVSSGTLSSSGDIIWLKFKYNGKTLLVADRGIRQKCSWTSLNNAGVVSGKTITIKDKTYICRLIKGATADPGSALGREWKDLICAFTPNDEVSNWSTYVTLCQERHTNSVNYQCVAVGGTNVDQIKYFGMQNDTDNSCWRPVLECVD